MYFLLFFREDEKKLDKNRLIEMLKSIKNVYDIRNNDDEVSADYRYEEDSTSFNFSKKYLTSFSIEGLGKASVRFTLELKEQLKKYEPGVKYKVSDTDGAFLCDLDEINSSEDIYKLQQDTP